MSDIYKMRDNFFVIQVSNFYNFSNILEYYLFNKFLNYLMLCGKKDIAFKNWIQFQFLIFLKQIKIQELLSLSADFSLNNDDFFINCTVHPLSLFLFMIKRVNILVNLKKKKIAGRTHYIPLFLDSKQQVLFTLKNFVMAARLRLIDLGIISKLYFELLNVVALETDKYVESQLLKRKKWLYSQAYENKFYIKFL